MPEPICRYCGGAYRLGVCCTASGLAFERDEAVAALRELVRLKDLKGDAHDYETNKPKAWAEARRVLGNFDALHGAPAPSS